MESVAQSTRKILLVHNFYGSAAPSGENEAYRAELSLLRSHGHQVVTFTRDSDEIRGDGVLGAIRGGLATPWNPWMAHEIKRRTKEFQPDIVHVHNTFPLISPAIFHAIGSQAARVITLHNYRLFCAAGIPTRMGQICTECLDTQSSWPSIHYGCYRDSRLSTLPLATSVQLHRRIGTWTTQVDAFILLTEFQRERMTSAGLPAKRVYVKPNFYPYSPTIIDWHKRTDCVVYVGRLSAEKGIESLVRAWMLWGGNAPKLQIIGDGPLLNKMSRLIESQASAQIEMLGQVPAAQAQAAIAHAKLLVLPSECFEGFPMVIREAFAYGTPVAASAIGPLPEIITNGINGVLFKAGDPTSLLQEVEQIWGTPGVLEQLSNGARRAFEDSYSASTNYRMLLNIYEDAIKHQQGRFPSK